MTRPLVLLGALVPMALAASPAMMNMATITDLQVACDKTGMSVTIDFSQPFNGIIYSKGFYSDDRCRHVKERSGLSSYTFRLDEGLCGTGREEARAGPSGDETGLSGAVAAVGAGEAESAISSEDTLIRNTIVIQFDPRFQEIWDTARRLTCASRSQYRKQIKFDPLHISMLDVVGTHFRQSDLKCWMDIKRGEYPNVRPLDGVLPIGEAVSVMVFLEDPEKRMDIAVQDCWARPTSDFEDPNAPQIQLTSTDGCPINKKLMGDWHRTYEKHNGGITLVTYSKLSAFKFPDYPQIYLTCNIEVCQNACERTCDNVQGIVVNTDVPVKTVPIPKIAECYPGSPNPACSHRDMINWCKKINSHPSCRKKSLKCVEHSQDPRCLKTGKELLKCNSGNQDRRCNSNHSDINIIDKPLCDINPNHPHCFETNEQTNNVDCSKNANHPACVQSTVDCLKNPGKTDCLINKSNSNLCFSGSTDPNCPLKEGVQTNQQTFENQKCIGNSGATACKDISVFEIPPMNIDLTNTPLKIICPEGSPNPICKMKSQTLNCILDPNHPSCVKSVTGPNLANKCHLGSTDPSCSQSQSHSTVLFKPDENSNIKTTPAPEFKAFGCNEPNDPKCQQEELFIAEDHDCEPDSRDERCIKTKKISKTPRKSDSRTTPILNNPPDTILSLPRKNDIKENKIVCEDGSDDIRCSQPVKFTCSIFPNHPSCSKVLKSPNIKKSNDHFKKIDCTLNRKHHFCRNITTIDICRLKPNSQNCISSIEKCKNNPSTPECIEMKLTLSPECSKFPGNKNCISSSMRGKSIQHNTKPVNLIPIPDVTRHRSDECRENPKSTRCLNISKHRNGCFGDSKSPMCNIPIECVLGSKKPICRGHRTTSELKPITPIMISPKPQSTISKKKQEHTTTPNASSDKSERSHSVKFTSNTPMPKRKFDVNNKHHTVLQKISKLTPNVPSITPRSSKITTRPRKPHIAKAPKTNPSVESIRPSAPQLLPRLTTRTPTSPTSNFVESSTPVVSTIFMQEHKKTLALPPSKKNFLTTKRISVETATSKSPLNPFSGITTPKPLSITSPSNIKPTVSKNIPNDKLNIGKQIGHGIHDEVNGPTESSVDVLSLNKPNKFTNRNNERASERDAHKNRRTQTKPPKAQVDFENFRRVTVPPSSPLRSTQIKSTKSVLHTTRAPKKIRIASDVTGRSKTSFTKSEKPLSTRKHLGKQTDQGNRKIMHGKDDHHGKDMDPRYHAFHSYLYQAAPRPRQRGRRSLPSWMFDMSTASSRRNWFSSFRRRRAVPSSTVMLHTAGGIRVAAFGGEVGGHEARSSAAIGAADMAWRSAADAAEYLEAFIEEVSVNDTDRQNENTFNVGDKQVTPPKNDIFQLKSLPEGKTGLLEVMRSSETSKPDIIDILPAAGLRLVDILVIFTILVSLFLFVSVMILFLCKFRSMNRKTSHI